MKKSNIINYSLTLRNSFFYKILMWVIKNKRLIDKIEKNKYKKVNVYVKSIKTQIYRHVFEIIHLTRV